MGLDYIMNNGQYALYNGMRVYLPEAAGGLTLLDGLLAYYKLDDASTGNVVDSLGSFTGTNYGMTQNASNGKIGGFCGYFKGTTDYVDLGAVLTNEPWTVSLWAKGAGNTMTLFGSSTVNSAPALIVNQDGNWVTPSLMNQGLATIGTASVLTSSTVWYHLVVNYAIDGTWNIYVNGINASTGINQVALTYADIHLGMQGTASYPYTGCLDEVAFWNRILSAEDVSTLYNNGIGKTYPFATYTVPSFLSTDGSTVGWYRSDISNSLTLSTDSSVSVWNDYLGSGHNLLQSSVTSQPKWSSSGILFDGVNDEMHTSTFTWNIPEFIYIVAKQPSWTYQKTIFDGSISMSGALVTETNSSPNISVNNGVGTVSNNSNFVLDTFAILRISFDSGGATTIQVNNTAISMGNGGGATNMSGFTLGAQGAGGWRWSNVQFKEIICRNVIDSSENQTLIYNYLSSKYNII